MDQRVIGLLPRIVRAWSRTRRLALDAQIAGHANDRDWVWGIGSLRSAQSAAAHSALDAECATAVGQAYGEAMIDLKQAYERVDHMALAVALANGPLPPVVSELLLQVYRAPRSLRSAGATSPWVAPRAGIVAGCPLADIALRCVVQNPADDVARAAPAITTRAYADDVKFSARGTADQVACAVARAVKTWDVSAKAFGGVLSRSKCTLSANTPTVGAN